MAEIQPRINNCLNVLINIKLVAIHVNWLYFVLDKTEDNIEDDKC